MNPPNELEIRLALATLEKERSAPFHAAAQMLALTEMRNQVQAISAFIGPSTSREEIDRAIADAIATGMQVGFVMGGARR